MDFKLNHLQKEIKCEEVGIADLPALKFGHLEDGTMVFNATAYLQSLNREEDYRQFSRGMRFWVERLATGYGVNPAKLFYANPDGTELYHEILTYIFVMYTDPDMISYFNDLIDDVMTNGMAFSDSFIIELATTRLPEELLKPTIQVNGITKNSSIRQ